LNLGSSPRASGWTWPPATGWSPRSGERKNALDNAAIESWFSSFKSEAIHPYALPKTRAEARTTLFRYVWAYNTQRLHSVLGYVPPKDYGEHASTCP
jgi:putative transposase